MQRHVGPGCACSCAGDAARLEAQSQLGTSHSPSYQHQGLGAAALPGCGVYSPLGRCPLGRGVRELFLGLTQAAALSRWGLQCEPSGRKWCFLLWAAGMGRAGVGDSPLGTQPFCCGTHCPYPAPYHSPMCCEAAREPRIALKVPGAFVKPRNGKTMKLERFWWPLPLGPSLCRLPKLFPGAFEQNRILTQNG